MISVHSRLRQIVFILVILAVLAAAYAAFQLAPRVHSSPGAASLHELIVEQCPSLDTHC